jgi:hypothetical protein
MPVNFATPIVHQTSANYTAFANALVVGQPFQQPVLSAPSTANSSSGLEIFIDPQNPDAQNIYAFLDGALSWEPSTLFVFEDRLVLQTNSIVLRGRTGLKALNMVEASPSRVVYGNPDIAGTQAALETLLTTAYSATITTARRANWHPSMRMRVRVNGVERFLKRYLDDFIPAATEITRLVTDFLAGTASALLTQIPVRAGELIGRAAPYTVFDPLPASSPFPLGIVTDPDRARRLTFITEDHCEQRINPLFYLHTFMNRMFLPARRRIVTSLTNVVAGGSLAHPLVTLFPALAGAARPAGRELIGGQSMIPLGSLNTLHGFPVRNPVSQLEWKYDTNRTFVVSPALSSGATAPRMTPNASEINRVDTLWTSHGAAIAAIAEACQIPCEIIIALITTESLPTLDERVVRLEPLRPGDRARLRAVRAAAPLERAYDLTVGIHGTVANLVDNGNNTATFDITLDGNRTLGANVLVTRNTFVLWGNQRLAVTANSGSAAPTTDYQITIRGAAGGAAITAETEAWILEGHSPPSPGVPNPWNGAALVRAGASTLTWDQLVTVVDATEGQRISPGLIQTLISTARGVVPWINDAIPDIFATLGIPPPPATAGAYLNDWLLHGAHSVLVGAAYIRLGYNHPGFRNGAITAPSCFDLPLVGGAYNAGATIRVLNTLWGLRFSGSYVERAGPSFNAAVNKFNNATPPVPDATVRFME